MRAGGIWLCSRKMPGLPRRASGGVQLQTARLLSELRRPLYGGERCAAGGRGAAPLADAAVGTELSLPVAVPVGEPTRRSLERLVHTIGQRVGAYLEHQGLVVRDIENTYRALESTKASAMDDLLGHSISYRIAVGPQK